MTGAVFFGEKEGESVMGLWRMGDLRGVEGREKKRGLSTARCELLNAARRHSHRGTQSSAAHAIAGARAFPLGVFFAAAWFRGDGKPQLQKGRVRGLGSGGCCANLPGKTRGWLGP